MDLENNVEMMKQNAAVLAKFMGIKDYSQEIEEINRDRENMLKEYEKKKEGDLLLPILVRSD